MATLQLADPTLFGNDAAEDEQADVFYSYAFERPELTPFADPEIPLRVVRAFKGEGKSALLRLAQHKVYQRNPDAVVLARTADELAPEPTRDDYVAWVRGWKKTIFDAFAASIGRAIGFAWTDDAMSLVEESEKVGFRSRTFISAILDRMKLPAAAAAALPERKLLASANNAEVVKRYLAPSEELWLFVDDVDKNFANTPQWRVKVAAFFDACRGLMNAVPQLRIRTAVRPNVWTIVKLEFESLSHVHQYVSDLHWITEDARGLLSKRIQAYLDRHGEWDKIAATLSREQETREEGLISMVFESPMRWGWRRQPHAILHTLSKHRPRWMIELAKVAAASAIRNGRTRITSDDIASELTEFGRRRIEDTVAEFQPQCPEIYECIVAFAQERDKFTTDQLLKLVDKKILNVVKPTIVGVKRVNKNNVAALLFEVGLFSARREFPDETYEHVTFSESPNLLRTKTNLDDGMSWEIHPVFRQALEIRDAKGVTRGTARRNDRRKGAG